MSRAGEDGRAAAVDRGPARVAAEAVGHLAGVAVDDADVLDLQPELVGGDLGHGGLLALAVAVQADRQADLAVGLDAHLGGVVAGGDDDALALPLGLAVGRLLDVEGHADTAVDALLGQLRVLLALLLVAELVQAELERGEVVAALEVELAGGDVRELADEVLAPHLGRVHVQLARDLVHDPLGGQAAVRPADAAVRAHRRLVRHHRVDVALVVADVVGAGDVVGRLPAVQRSRHRPARVGAVVGQDPGADAEDASVVAHRGADPVDLLARVHARLQVLAAVADPLDRGLHPPRQVGDEDVLGVQQRLLAEAAADVGRDHPDVVLGNPQKPRRRRAEQVRRLVAVVDHELVAELVVRGRDGAGLHAHGGVALRGELEVDGEVGLLEGGVGVAGHAVEPHVDVVGRTLVHHGGALFHRLVDRRHRGQGLVLDPDLVGAVLGRVPVHRPRRRRWARPRSGSSWRAGPPAASAGRCCSCSRRRSGRPRRRGPRP